MKRNKFSQSSPVIPGAAVSVKDCPATVADPPPLPDENTLILKPDYTKKEVGDVVVYKTYLVNNETGVEMELTNANIVYRSADPNKVAIGGRSGSASMRAEGIVEISAEWNNMIAFAEVCIVDACSKVQISYMVILDSSVSMEQKFSKNPVPAGQVGYDTKFKFAKDVARHLINRTNESKDRVGLMEMNFVPEVHHEITGDKGAVSAEVANITPSGDVTDIRIALEQAIVELNKEDGNKTKVIIILSDGEVTAGLDPTPVATDFKNGGGFIISVGFRAHGSGFALLKRMATQSMFINALPENSVDVKDDVTALRGLFCGGNCTDEPGGFNMPQLDFNDFLYWDVENHVDLIGGTPPNQLFDFLPGNGLYVDMAGSQTPFKGKLTTKQAYSYQMGKEYEIRVKIAGNQRTDRIASQKLRIRVLDAANSVDVTEEITNWRQDLTEYRYRWTAPADDTGKVSIELVDEDPTFPAFGLLIDSVLIKKITDGDNHLVDIFDYLNYTVVPDPCATIPAGPTECLGYGCAQSAPEDQIEDPDPLDVHPEGAGT